MKIPLRVKLGGHLLLVNHSNKPFEAYQKNDKSPGMKAGVTWMGEEVILLNRRLSREQQEESFLHEVIHHILFRMGRNDECVDEQLVQGLASWMYSFLKDNDLLKK